MSGPLVLAGLLVLAVLLAQIRLVLRQQRAEPAQRSRGWRIAVLLLAQPLCALLLYLTLLPPTVPGAARTLVLATAGAKRAQLDAADAGEPRVSLPEAPAIAGAERVPDLATALRRHPGTRRLVVVGAGLEARDRDAARGLALVFRPPTLPRGVIALAVPRRVAAGSAFQVSGRVAALHGGVVELVDPGRKRVDRMALPADGRFNLGATTRTSGLVLFKLQVRDARRRLVESLDVPLHVVADPPPRVLLLAAAPNPELKFLRRWAADAGLPVHAQVGVGGGMQLGDASIALNAANLARFDLVVLDERTWASLGAGARGALVEALHQGLGVLLRVTGPLPGSTRAQLRALGFVIDADSGTSAVRLYPAGGGAGMTRARIGPGTRDAPTTDVQVDAPALTRRALRWQAADAVPLLRDAAGQPVALWRAEGRGRIGIATLTDSYRLVLRGRRDLHAELWSATFAVLARSRAAAIPEIDSDARPGERMRLCGLAANARVLAPDGGSVVLLPDVASAGCAAYWPRVSGWHALQQGESRWPFHVRSGGAGAGLHAAAVREATLQLAASAGVASVSSSERYPGPRWPWFLGWLTAAAGLWWLERARAGRVLRS